jgi:hypothetical protein
MLAFTQPQLSFRMAEPVIIQSGTNYNLEFVIQVKANETGKYYSSGQVLLEFNNSAFSSTSAIQFAFLRDGISAKYDNDLDDYVYEPVNTFSGTAPNVVRYFALIAKDAYLGEDPSAGYLAQITLDWQTFAKVRTRILDLNEIAELSFVQSSMNGEQFYLSAPNDELPFLSPNFYEAKDFNDLYLGRIYADAAWTQHGGLDWAAEVNTSVWDGFPTLATGDFLANALRIHDGAILTIASDAGLKATGNTNISGPEALVIKSVGTGLGSSGYFIDNGTIAYENGGSVQVDRYLSETIYHYVSSPVSNATNAVLQGVNGTDDFWRWSEVDNQWENLNATGASGDLLAVTKGYAVAYKNSAKTVPFVGELNTGEVPCAVTYTPNWLQKGFNFIGNPYASAITANGNEGFIKVNELFFDETGGGLYFWDEAAGYNGVRWDYASYSLTGGVAGGVLGGQNSFEPNGIIAPSQGFMVNVNQAGDLLFNKEMRTTTQSYFFKEDEMITRSWLSVTGPEGDYNEILTGFLDEGKYGIDFTDALKMKGNTNLAFYTMLDGKDYVIQGLPTFDPSKSYAFPLGLDAGIAGAYNFNLRETENFDPQVKFILEDKLAGVFFDLNGDAEYVAQLSATGEIRDRFVFHINGVTAMPEIDQKLTKVYAANNQIFISLTGNNKILNVEVFNTLGQTVLRTPVNATETTLNLQGSNVVYIVKVTTSQGVESHKVLLH